MSNEDCIFCKIAKKEIKVNIIYEDDNFIAFPDANPRAEGHTLIITKKHYQTILDMPSTLGNEMLDAIKSIAIDLIKQGKAEGFNTIINSCEPAGQVVHHAHIHIIPRKKGDGLKILE